MDRPIEKSFQSIFSVVGEVVGEERAKEIARSADGIIGRGRIPHTGDAAVHRLSH